MNILNKERYGQPMNLTCVEGKDQIDQRMRDNRRISID
jgi:hypothetical protein